MVARRSFRLVVYAGLGVLAGLAILYATNPSLPARTTGYFQSLVLPKAQTSPDEWFDDSKWFYQGDLDNNTFALPKFDIAKLRHLPPHNYKGPNHESFAVFYFTRNATFQDPYFYAVQSIIHRLLWDPNSKSTKHPITVYVADFVSQEHRDYFMAAGAMVRQIDLRPFHPDMAGVPTRLMDMFAKLEMWKQTDFSRIAYFDGDAFPLKNIDDIFESAPEQKCIEERMTEQEQTYAADVCNYVFAGHMENDDIVNAGVLVFKPNWAMYDRLISESLDTEGWDTGYMEQAFLSHAFHNESAFPVSHLGPEWNAFPDYLDKGIPIKIVHDKMWSHYFENGLWVTDEWTKGWSRLKTLYESDEFVRLRKRDREDELARMHRGV